MFHTWTVKRATSLFNSICSNIAKQVILFCCQFYRSFSHVTWPSKKLRYSGLQPYNTDNCWNHAICWCFTCKLPFGQYWNKIHMLGVSTHAPINWVKLSWRMSRIWKDIKRIGYQKKAYSTQSDKVCRKTTLSKVEIMIAFESYISNLF